MKAKFRDSLEHLNLKMNFWQTLSQNKTQIIGLSPMDGLTDAAFRYIIAKYAKLDVIFTEFINVDSMYHSKEELFQTLLYHEIERPVVAQIFGKDPELFYLSAQLIAELGFDGVDINMGCPSKNVSSRGAGAGLIKTPELALQIIAATKQGVKDWLEYGLSPKVNARMLRKLTATREKLNQLGTKTQQRQLIPVSIKTRIGWSENEVETWIPQLLKAEPAAISLHGRTFKQLYSGKADWETIARAAELVKIHNSDPKTKEKTLLLGNGDVQNREQAIEYAQKYGLDGILIGRACLGDPWIFLPEAKRPQTQEQKIPLILEHTRMYEQLFPKHFFAIRKHLAWYFKGFPGASELRQELVRANSYAQVEQIIFRSQSLTR